jgi:hypothetical protein
MSILASSNDSQMAHARSRSPRNCRWEDQGWKCVCCSCEAALRTWKGGHFEREELEKQPKGTAERFMIGELHSGIHTHTTKGYHPSVRIVPDFVEGRRKLCRRSQDLKDMLILSPPVPLKSQHVEKDDPWLKQQISDTVNNAAQRNLNALTPTELEARSERLKVSLSKGSLASGSGPSTNPFLTHPFGCNTETASGTCMKRFGTEGELLQHIIDMCHDNYHGISVEQAKAWAEHELRDVTQQVDSVAKACASRTHALWTNSSAASSESGTLQPQVGGAAPGSRRATSENATEVHYVEG